MAAKPGLDQTQAARISARRILQGIRRGLGGRAEMRAAGPDPIDRSGPRAP